MHKLGVIHCDLKPENILFGLSNNRNRIYLIDFEMSKFINKSNNG